MKTKLLWVLAAASLLLAGCAANLTGQATSHEAITVGGAFALTGDAASWGTEEQRAVLLAFEEANAESGVNGRPLALVSEDTRTDAKDTLSAVQKLIDVNHVQVIIGPTWGDSFGSIVAPVGEERHVVQITPSAALETVEHDGVDFPYYFSTYYPQTPEIQTEVSFLQERHAKTVVSIRDADLFNVQFNDRFVAEARTAGLTVASVMDIPTDTVDYKTVLLKAKQYNPDVLVVNFFQVEQVGLLLRQAAELGMADVIVVSSTSTQTAKLVDDYGAYAAGKVFYSYPDLETDAFRSFEAAYETRWGEQPSSAAAGTAYDAARAVIAALRTGARSGDEMRDALNTLEIPGTIVPTLRFTPLGQVADAPYVMKTVQDGQFVVVER